MAVTREQVAAIYVATFNRAPDAAGLDYWVNDSFGGNPTIEQIAASFFDSAEAQATYPSTMTTTEKVQAAYTNLFGRTVAADSEDVLYWVGQLDAGSFTQAEMLLAMQNGALGDDATVLANKTTVGLYYVDAGLTGTDFDLTSVSADTATVTAAKQSVAVEVAANAAYAESILPATATDVEKAAAALLTAQTAAEALAQGAVQADIDALVATITADNAASITLSKIVALANANTAVSDYLAAVDSAYDTNADGSVTALEITGELLGAANAYNAISTTNDFATDGSDTAAEIADMHTANVAALNAQVTIDKALLAVEQAKVDAVSGLQAAIANANTKAGTYETAIAAAVATQQTLDMAVASYEAAATPNGTVTLNADGTLADSDFVAHTAGAIADGNAGTTTTEVQEVTVGAFKAGQTVTIDGVKLTVTADMTATEAATAWVALYNAATGKNFTATNVAGVITLDTASATDYIDYDPVQVSFTSTDAINPGYTALAAAHTADVAADTAEANALTALETAVFAVVKLETPASVAAGTNIIVDTAGVITLDYTDNTGGDDAPITAAYLAAQGVVAASEQTVVDLQDAKAAFDAINAIDDALTPLETVAADAATALPGAWNLANGANNLDVVNAADVDVAFITDLVSGDAVTVANFVAGTDYLYIGSDYTYNTGALTTGNNSVLEFFMTEAAGSTVITFETEVFGSAATAEKFTVTLTGVAMADVVFENGMIVGA